MHYLANHTSDRNLNYNFSGFSHLRDRERLQASVEKRKMKVGSIALVTVCIYAYVHVVCIHVLLCAFCDCEALFSFLRH